MSPKGHRQPDEVELAAIAETSQALRSRSNKLKAALLSAYGSDDPRHMQANKIDDLVQSLVSDIIANRTQGDVSMQREEAELGAIAELARALGSGSRKLRTAISSAYGHDHQRHSQAIHVDDNLQPLVADLIDDNEVIRETPGAPARVH
jgi:hypothetical protein